MVQLPEVCDDKSEACKLGYKTISEIGKERIRRSAAKIRQENPGYIGDLGFKVYKLDSSNIRTWNPDRSNLEQTLRDHTEHLFEGRSEEDVLSGKTVYSIGYGVLFACLSKSINPDEVETLAQGIIDWHKEIEPSSDTQVVFRDSAFTDDIAKTNMTAILEQNGIAHVRSL
jgi:adenine-specific DNA-methyltransferase